MAKKKNELSSDPKFNKRLGWGVAAACFVLIALTVLMALYSRGVL